MKTPAIAIVNVTGKRWTVEGLHGPSWTSERIATLCASQRAADIGRSVWICFGGERTRLLRF